MTYEEYKDERDRCQIAKGKAEEGLFQAEELRHRTVFQYAGGDTIKMRVNSRIEPKYWSRIKGPTIKAGEQVEVSCGYSYLVKSGKTVTFNFTYQGADYVVNSGKVEFL